MLCRNPPAAYFTDLSDLTGSYYEGFPSGVNDSGIVTFQGRVIGDRPRYHTYIYTGGINGTVVDVISLFRACTTTAAAP